MSKRASEAIENETSPKRQQLSALENLQRHSTVVADTGDFEAIEAYSPQDATTNPSLLYQACQMIKFEPILTEVVKRCVDAAEKPEENSCEVADEICDRLAVRFGCKILQRIPGVVSTEVDASLSFDTDKSVSKARKLIKMYEEAGIKRDRVLIKMATTWEGCEAAKILEKEGIHCNMTLLFSKIQAVAACEAGATLISPFVGRILDWHLLNNKETTSYAGEDDPGVKSVEEIYSYLKGSGSPTVVMGASFRNIGEILALAGCDKLTIAPKLLDELKNTRCNVPLRLDKSAIAPGSVDRISVTEASFRWQLNEDQMATEKLSQGIRLFNADQIKLKKFVISRLPF